MQSDDPSSMAVVQHERFVLWVLVRYLPFVLGAAIVLLFGGSVVHDNQDLAHCSWAGGGDFLAVFGDLGRALLGPLFIASALFRRGFRRIVRIERLDDEGLHALDEAGKRLEIPKSAVRSVFRYAMGDGTDAVVLETASGVLRFGFTGDRITLTVDPATARKLEAHFATRESVPVALGTRSPRVGGAMAAASLVLGTLVGVLLYKWIAGVAHALPRAAYYLPVSPDANRGWLSGLTITSMGLVHAVLAMITRPPPISLSDEAVHIGGFMRVTVSFRNIASVVVRGRTLTLHLDDDTSVTRRFLTVDQRKLEGLASEIRRRVAETTSAATVPAGLERRNQPVREWAQALAARARIGRYRDGAFDPAILESCLRSPVTPREVRVGAALALAHSGEPEARARLRVVADDLPPPSLRALVEELAEGEADEESITAALAHGEAHT
ncbi:MAG: hypothetical protein U0414_07595 [Polyangiaceae bacterium]